MIFFSKWIHLSAKIVGAEKPEFFQNNIAFHLKTLCWFKQLYKKKVFYKKTFILQNIATTMHLDL
jgi:hypothetical protein